ncbi:MAG TPA: DUF2314 domain-containing protein [Allosphingosinicella sp.]|nr:DUF2314 domain-containing protein [Allosphingosinicella sp.]
MLKPFMLAAGLLLAGAAGAAAQVPAGQGGDSSIIDISAADAEMNAAIAGARRELPAFYARMARPGPDEHRFAVKFDILPGDGAEYVWARDLDRSTVPMTGVLMNQPEATSEQIGQRVPIPETEIIDWGYVRGQVAQGYHTQRVLLGHMPPEEAAALRRRMGW